MFQAFSALFPPRRVTTTVHSFIQRSLFTAGALLIVSTWPILHFSPFLAPFQNYLSIIPIFLSSLSVPFGRTMPSPSFVGACTDVISSLLTCIVQISQTKELEEMFRTSSLNTVEYLKWGVQADTASLQQKAYVLRTEVERRKAYSYALIFASKDPPLLREAETEHFRQILSASMALRTYAASDGRDSERFLTLFSQKAVSLTLLGGRTFLQSVSTRRKEAAKSILS